MNTDQKRQTTLRVTYSNIPLWQSCVEKMKACKTLDALVTLQGPPHRKVKTEAFEIWHYPLGIESGMSYSIHVSVWPDHSKQVFMYFEPTPPRRRWWQFWKAKDDSSAQQRACT